MKIALSTRSFVGRTAAALGCICALGAMSCSDEADEEEGSAALKPGELSFFVSSTTHDGNLGGLTGADKICQDLAAAAGAGSRTWHAYLSAANNGTPINAKDRIGTGPWYNSNGVLMANNLTELHALTGDSDRFITEKKAKVNGQWNSSNGMNGAPANEHDIMTGSDSTGSLLMNPDPMTGQSTCADWTSNTMTPGPQVGHTDGMGPMMNTATPNFTSWNGGHAAAGCSTADLAARGGAGRIYCFSL